MSSFKSQQAKDHAIEKAKIVLKDAQDHLAELEAGIVEG